MIYYMYADILVSMTIIRAVFYCLQFHLKKYFYRKSCPDDGWLDWNIGIYKIKHMNILLLFYFL